MTEARRPSFAADFPREAALDDLVDAFAQGDYARVRSGAPALASSDDAAVRDAAKSLVERTQPDPLATALLAITAALLVLVTVYWSVHGKAPAQQPLPSPPPMEHSRS